jgi:hypothetical protein
VTESQRDMRKYLGKNFKPTPAQIWEAAYKAGGFSFYRLARRVSKRWFTGGFLGEVCEFWMERYVKKAR